ncbi:hypothetical protein OESDEN_04448 [Oesophagostomum dentatum]|uniref:Glucosylceramidase n=1 Tax=Oesophagostomum dentatum TaxID=61180 RepID=A0A0B1TJN3_OESDE|nr:hypothetical protein OESDEN_04448 [Oesophagostomum dentatum]
MATTCSGLANWSSADRPRELHADRPCARKVFGHNINNIACVCNATYCDEIQQVDYIPHDKAFVYVSSRSGKRFEKSIIPITKASNKGTVRVDVDPRRKHQSIIGFGGAFTDAAGINIASLKPQTRRKLLESYFGPKGNYSETQGDMDMKHFSLALEDLKFKIPFILEAMKLAGGNIRLYASPWSAPGWMKENGQMKIFGIYTSKTWLVRLRLRCVHESDRIWGIMS